jgi:hypothetical protein
MGFISLEHILESSLSIGVTITIIRCAVYLLQIFKLFQRLKNNPVYFTHFPALLQFFLDYLTKADHVIRHKQLYPSAN